MSSLHNTRTDDSTVNTMQYKYSTMQYKYNTMQCNVIMQRSETVAVPAQ